MGPRPSGTQGEGPRGDTPVETAGSVLAECLLTAPVEEPPSGR